MEARPQGSGVQMEGRAPKGCAGSPQGIPGDVEGVLKEKTPKMWGRSEGSPEKWGRSGREGLTDERSA